MKSTEEKLAKLEKILNAFDKNTITEEDFVAAFKQVTDFIKQSNVATAGILTEIFKRLDSFALQLKGDNEEDRKLVKQIVGQALAELHTELEKRMESIVPGKDGEPGKDADETAILAKLVAQIPAAPTLPDPETPDQTVEKVNKSSLLIAKERIEGLVDLMSNMAANAVSAVGITTTNFFKNGGLIGRAKNINFVEGTSTTLNLYQTGDQMNVSISSTAGGGGTAVAEEVPSGSINSSNTSFTVAHTPLAGTFRLYLNGTRQQAGGSDYTLSGTTITFNTAPQSGSILFVDYSY